MPARQIVIELEDDTEGHSQGIVESGDTDWLEDRLRQDSGKTKFRVVMGDEDDDTEGHAFAGSTVRVSLEDEDDTEGHAIAIHFPSRKEADAFRKRLLVTGVLVGTVALGAAGGVGLSALQSDDGAAGAGAVQSSVTGSDWTQAERPDAAAGSGAYANYQEAAANEGARQGAADAANAGAYSNYQEAAANEGARQGAADAANAGAYSNYQEAAANEGARQGGAQATTQSSTTDDDGSSELNNIGGPTPR